MTDVTKNEAIEADGMDSVIAALEAEVESDEVMMMVDDEVLEAAVAGAECEEMVAEVEEETAMHSTSEELADATPPTAASPEEKKAKAVRPRKTFSKPGDALLAITADPGNFAFSVSDEASEKARDAFVSKLNDRKTTAKKVAEKVINFYHNAFGSASLSNYTQMAIDLLREKGEVTSADLVAHYESRPYSKGTARAQSSQMMQLLPMLGIAERDGKSLKLRGDSTFVALLGE